MVAPPSPTPAPWNQTTPTPPGTPVDLPGKGAPTIHVTQGPAWVVEWVAHHQPLLDQVQGLLLVVTLGVAAAGYYRGGGVDAELVHRMAANGVLVLIIMVTTHASVTLLDVGYLTDVAIGVGAGYAIQQCVVRAVDQRFGGADRGQAEIRDPFWLPLLALVVLYALHYLGVV